MATMVDVARHAGVSISTVSHVINGTRNVEPATRDRVLDAIERTGYRQDALARALRRSRTDSIGLVVSDAGEPAFADMVHGVEDAVARQGFTLLLANSAEDAERERRAVDTLLDRRVDGIIVARAAESGPRLLNDLTAAALPVVLLDRVFPDAAFDQVGAENRDSMRRLVRHLVSDCGRRRLAIVAGDTRVPTLRERLDGVTDGLRDVGLEPDSAVILDGTDDSAMSQGLAEAVKSGADAIVANSTPLAVVGLQVLQEAGLRPGQEVAFATFDGFPNPDLFEPRLTTVRQPAFDMGVAAVNLLLDRFAHPDAPPRTVRLRQTLEIRASTAGT